MEKSGSPIKSRRGSAMAIAMMVLLVLSILIAGFLTVSLTEAKTAIRNEKQKQAYYIARSGAEAVAKHIIINPDSAQGLIDAPKSSPPVPLGNGTFEVDVSGSIKDRVIIESTGYVGDVIQKVSLTLIPGITAWTPPDFGEFEAGVFSKTGIELYGSSYIDGSAVTNSIAADSVHFDWTAKVSGNLYIGPGGIPSEVIDSPNPNINENVEGQIINLSSPKSYTMPIFPEYPEELEEKGDFIAGRRPRPPYYIEEDGHYDSIVVNSELIINVGGDDRIIRVGDLDVSGKITILGSGNLILYIEDSFTLGGGATINSSGNPKALLIYYEGSDPINIRGRSNVRGTIFAETASINVSGSGSISGNIITNGENVNIEGGSSNTVLSIFAPGAQVRLTGGVSVEGSIIAEHFVITGGSNVTYNENIFFPDPLTEETSRTTLGFSQGPWK